MLSPIQHTELVLNPVRQRTDRVLLFYSAGKDSIVLLDILAKRFKKVVCCFMYFVKDLEHIEKFIRDAENRYVNVSFIQLPHYGMATIYKYGLYTTPNTNITRKTTLNDIDHVARQKTSIDFTFYGWKQDDGINRRLALRSYLHEGYNEKTAKVYPLSKWSEADVHAYIRLHKLPKPIKYGIKRSNGIGFNLDCLLWMKKNYPSDLRKFLIKFPLAERLIFEHEHKKNAA